MRIECKTKVKHNYKKINTIIKNLPKFATESIESVLKNIRGYAIRLEKGHNSNGILCEMIDMSTKEVKGRVYADPSKFMSNGQSYLWFEYFGTGKYAEQDHIGNTKHFIESGYTEWLIPVKGDLKLNYQIITIKSEDGTSNQFYLAHRRKSKSLYRRCRVSKQK